MKRYLIFILTSILAVALLSGCSGTSNNNAVSTDQTESPSVPLATLDTSPDVSTQTPNTNALSASTVYMTSDISSDGLMAIYKELGFNATARLPLSSPQANRRTVITYGQSLSKSLFNY